MAIQLWDTLPRNQNDDQLIAEAINAAVETHNDDVDAHLDENQSLQSHRANEIIDHRAESVVNDKLRANSRRYMAIVDPNSESDYDTLEEAVAYTKTRGGGDIYITRGYHYLSSTVTMPPTISLQGDGMNETYILSANAFPKQLVWTAFDENSIGWLSGCIYTPSSDIVTYTTMNNTAVGGLVGIAIKFGGAGAWYYITEVISSTKIRVDRVVTPTPGTATGSFTSGLNFTNNQKAAETLTGRDPAEVGIYPGHTIFEADSSQRLKVAATEKNGTVHFYQKYTGTSGVHGIDQSYDDYYNIYCDGLTLGDQYDNVSLQAEEDGTAMTITACEFAAKSTFNKLHGTDKTRTIIRDCHFSSASANWVGTFTNTIFENCIFNATQNNSRAFQISNNVTVNDCVFRANGYTPHYWIEITGGPATLSNCTFENYTSQTFSGARSTAYDETKDITNCTFGLAPGKTFQVTGGDYVFIGNKFIKSSGSPLTLASGSNRNIFSFNFTVTAITNSGTVNTVVSNVTG